MAQKIVTIYTDDLTGKESSDAGTHTFAVDGVAYEIDLGPDSYDKLLDALAPFIKAGHKVGRTRGASGPRKSGPVNNDTADIRAWAKDNGYDVNDRGRVSATVRDAYEAAH
ncbi:histone-like nucleoid-structuring protein Lsr2 [Streptomyces sp. RKAG337]|uniref:histone-like nucleoid-structuring protein Lsr2 n=1 Tax=Streptomyces sp. RKAG337 TaxID=2893404 RepID=UPI00203329B6|nr:Lsr2 family protein [Streptomyces sp. RKAG337]MCM2429340.1 Lsr2 family protein [Streptomyces sp. RKAG337]